MNREVMVECKRCGKKFAYYAAHSGLCDTCKEKGYRDYLKRVAWPGRSVGP